MGARCLVVLVCLVALSFPVPAAAGPSMEPCEGVAPAESTCQRSFVVERDFSFVISHAVGAATEPTTSNWILWLHYYTAGDSKTVACPSFSSSCRVIDDATFMQGETLTLVVAVTGRGYWRVRLA